MKILFIGLPNSGKSTIFNKLSGKKHALVSAQEGLTRNFRSKIINNKYLLIDSPGISYINDFFSVCSDMVMQKANEADLLLYVIDNDITLLDTIRKLNKPTIVLLRKPIDIYLEYKSFILENNHDFNILNEYLLEISQTDYQETFKTIKVACVGMMNSGKSTIINKIIGEDKLLVYDKDGVTTDSIRVDYKDVTFIDTAGIQYKDRLILNDMNSAIELSHIVVYVVNAVQGLTKHDMRICKKIFDEGRAIIILINKCDLSPFRLNKYHDIPIIHVKKNYNFIYNSIIDLYNRWNTRFQTALVNKILPKLTLARTIKIKYIQQLKTRPPHFTLYGTFNQMNQSIEAQIKNKLSQMLNLSGIPIRISYVKKKNPYVHNGT